MMASSYLPSPTPLKNSTTLSSSHSMTPLPARPLAFSSPAVPGDSDPLLAPSAATIPRAEAAQARSSELYGAARRFLRPPEVGMRSVVSPGKRR